MTLLDKKREMALLESHAQMERDLRNGVAQIAAATRRVSHAALYLAHQAAAGNPNGEAEYMAVLKPALDQQRDLLAGYLDELLALQGLSDPDLAVVANTLATQTAATGFDMASYLASL